MALFRSWLFVPGSDSKKLEKVRNLSADVIVYDLEDAVAIGEKETARKKIIQALDNNPAPYSVVRVNSVDTPYFQDDVKQMATTGVNGIMLPKSESTEQIMQLDNILSSLEKESGIENKIEIIPLIESAKGIYHAYQIAAASARVKCLAFGSADYVLDIDGELTEDGLELLFPRSQLVNVSRAAGIQQPIDAVNVNIKNLEGLKRETQFIKRLGFQGKLAIHPMQVDVINEVFLPSKDEINQAKEIVSAYEQSVQKGLGAVQVNGKMVDVPVVERAKRMIEKAKLLNL